MRDLDPKFSVYHKFGASSDLDDYLRYINTSDVLEDCYPARAARARKSDRGWCPYMCLYVCGPKKNLNRTLAIDSPFQTYAVGLLVKFID